MKTVPQNRHEADSAMLSQIADASEFVTSIFLGRGEYAKHSSATIDAAREIGAQMEEYYRNGRKALVYAILPNGRQFLVPSGYQA